MSDKFVTFNEGRSTPTGLPQAVDTKINTSYATKAELNSAIIGTGGVVSPSVSRILASSDPDTPLAEGDLLLLYAPPLTHFEDWSDELAGWSKLWHDIGWSVTESGVSVTPGTGTRRSALVFDSAPISDVETLAKVSSAAFGTDELTAGIGIRTGGEVGTETSYLAFMAANRVTLAKYESGTYYTIASNSLFSPLANSPMWVRFRLFRGVLSAKFWMDGQPEPAGWTISHTVGTTISAGSVALVPGSLNTAVTYHQVSFAELDNGEELPQVVAP